MNSVALPK